jgi:trk system potassium uptake protein TrkA
MVARVKNAANAWLDEPEGVDVLVSVPHTIGQLIEEQVAVGDVGSCSSSPTRTGRFFEATLPEDSLVAGKLARVVTGRPCASLPS